MISTSQKFSTLSLLALGFALATISHGEDPTQIESKAPSGPTFLQQVVKKNPAAAPNKEPAETRHFVAKLRKKLEQQAVEIKNLELRILAGNQAGAELERQLDECLEHRRPSAKLEAQLADAQALAKREHAQAEKITAKILKQVDAQKAIARELKETIALINREREALLAELKAKPKDDPDDANKRLIEENEKLTRIVKEAWAKAKEQEVLRVVHEKKAVATIRQRQAAREKTAAMAKELAALKKIRDQVEHKLGKRVQDLTVQRLQAELAADELRDELVREKIARRKLEEKLKASDPPNRAARPTAG